MAAARSCRCKPGQPRPGRLACHRLAGSCGCRLRPVLQLLRRFEQPWTVPVEGSPSVRDLFSLGLQLGALLQPQPEQVSLLMHPLHEQVEATQLHGHSGCFCTSVRGRRGDLISCPVCTQ